MEDSGLQGRLENNATCIDCYQNKYPKEKKKKKVVACIGLKVSRG